MVHLVFLELLDKMELYLEVVVRLVLLVKVVLLERVDWVHLGQVV